ncbi:MAG: GtrA family protein [[Clostridium] nexile]
MEKLIKQIMKFGVVGGSAFVIDYGIMIFLTEIFHINYLISSGISFAVSVIFNYVMSVKWVFEVEENRDKKQEFALFVVLSIMGLGINQLIMWLAVEKFGVFYMISKICATIVVMVYNFVTRKLFLEKKG